MAKVSIDEARKSTSGGDFFSLKKDKEKANIRFMYKTTKDVDIYSVHEVKIGDKRRLVDCIKDPSNPESHCPFCDAGVKKLQRVFLLVYVEQEEKVKIWERSFQYYDRNILPILEQLNSEEIVGTRFRVMRNGAPGDMKTTYPLMLVEADDTKMEDFEEELPRTDLTILQKTAEEMEEFVETGKFPEQAEEAESEEEERPAKKSSGFKKSAGREVAASEDEKPKRRSRF